MTIFHYSNYSRKPGVYIIFNNLNWRIYIGSCKRFKERWTSHMSSLHSNKHHNSFLQADFKKCLAITGNDHFLEFYVLEVINGEQENRLDREQYYLDIHYGKPNCYNLRSSAYPANTTKISLERRRKMSERYKGKSYEEVYGIEKAQEMKRKLSESKKGKTWEDICGTEKAIKMKNKASKRQKKRLQGKTYEEIYGVEKASEIKEKISETRTGTIMPFNGKSFEEQYGLERAIEIKKKISQKAKGRKSKLIGKSWEEIFGIEKATEMRKNMSKRLKGKSYKERYGIEIFNRLKGKTYKEVYGTEKAKKLKKKLSKAHKGKKYKKRKNQ